MVTFLPSAAAALARVVRVRLGSVSSSSLFSAARLVCIRFASAVLVNHPALRYFNVFGPRQDPDGAYAAVIPKWIVAIRGDDVFINGDGSTSRDFCFVANVVQANLRAALADGAARDQFYNVAVGGRTDLNGLFATLRDTLAAHGVRYERDPVYRDFRAGDVRHSQADVSKARRLLGYEPRVTMKEGVALAMPWYLQRLG